MKLDSRTRILSASRRIPCGDGSVPTVSFSPALVLSLSDPQSPFPLRKGLSFGLEFPGKRCIPREVLVQTLHSPASTQGPGSNASPGKWNLTWRRTVSSTRGEVQQDPARCSQPCSVHPLPARSSSPRRILSALCLRLPFRPLYILTLIYPVSRPCVHDLSSFPRHMINTLSLPCAHF